MTHWQSLLLVRTEFSAVCTQISELLRIYKIPKVSELKRYLVIVQNLCQNNLKSSTLILNRTIGGEGDLEQ